MQDVIAFNCPECGHWIKVAGEHAGKQGRCKKCGSIITIPTEVHDEEPSRRTTTHRLHEGSKD